MKPLKNDWLKEAIELENGCEVGAGPEVLPFHLLESHANSARQRDKSTVEPTMNEALSPRELIDCLIRQASYTAGRLARTLGVSHLTISRWHAGEAIPGAHNLERLMKIARSECASLFDLGLSHRDFVFLCSFAEHYPENHPTLAYAALRGALRAPIIPPHRGNGIELHLHVRATALPSGVRAHCFADNAVLPRVFIVLVDESLSESEQYAVAWGEVWAHVRNKLVKLPQMSDRPEPLIHNS